MPRYPRAEPDPSTPLLTFTLPQLAERLQVGASTIRLRRRRGEFPFATVPGCGLRWSRAEVERLLAQPELLRLAVAQRRRAG